VSLIGFSALALYLMLLALKAMLGWRYAATHPEAETLQGSVSVMQPILSGDPLLETTLHRNLKLAPPWVRFVWLIDEDDAEGQRIASKLAQDSRVEIVLCPPAGAATNPKTAKLQRGLGQVNTDYVAVLDDDTMLERDNLAKALAALQRADLYTGLPCYLPGDTFCSALVAHFVNNNSILTYLPLLWFKAPFTINGMFYVMRTSQAKQWDCFAAIEGKLCDDFALADHVKSRGGIIQQGITPQTLQTSVVDGRQYMQLMHRWFAFANVLVASQRWYDQVLLAAFLGLPPLLLWLGLLSVASGWPGAAIVAAALLFRHGMIRTLHYMVFRAPPAFSWYLSIIAELLQPLHLLHSIFWRTLRWRTRRVYLEPGGGFSYVDR
jgi:ceramide glucosyltransferase